MPVQLEVAVLAADAGGRPPAAKREPSSEGGRRWQTKCDRIKLDSEHEDGTCRFRLAGRQARNPQDHHPNRRGTPVEGAALDDA